MGSILETVMLVCYKNLKDDVKKYTFLIDVVNETSKNIEKKKE